MKKITTYLKAFLAMTLVLTFSINTNAQWNALISPTGENLNDLDFYDENIGVIVGNRDVILMTTDGGNSWTDINGGAIQGDIHSVEMKSPTEIYVSKFAPGVGGSVYRTLNAGGSWVLYSGGSATAHRMDVESNFSPRIYVTSGAQLKAYNPYQIAYSPLGSTMTMDQLEFYNQTHGQLLGNVAGFLTNSAYFIRTEDGANWYKGDVFSFPNADAYTAMAYSHQDTVMMFTNTHVGFMPSIQNHLIKLYDFAVTEMSPGDTAFTFRSQVVNNTMPAYINDAHFETPSWGFALGGNAFIYETTDGGITWNPVFSSHEQQVDMEFVNGYGYSVGERGDLLKYSPITTSTKKEIEETNALSIYPNPANNKLNLSGDLIGKMISIYNVLGENIKKINTSSNQTQIDINELPSGSYFIKVVNEEGVTDTARFLKL